MLKNANCQAFSASVLSKNKKITAKLFLPHLFRFLRSSLFYLTSSIYCLNSFGQNVSVNQNTGTAHVSIPIYTISYGQISSPVSLEYNAIGIRSSEPESVLGTGWQLSAGGAVTRIVRDLPDDVGTDLLGNTRQGWFYNNIGSSINSFSVANDNNPATCTDETSDISYMNSHFSVTSDVEPDIYFVQAPGLNCQLVYDQTTFNFKVISYQDIQIRITNDVGSSGINSFTLTNDKGIVYTFDIVEKATMTTSSSNPAAISQFKRQFNLFKNGITYNQRWMLSKITDPSGNYLTFYYVNNIATRTFTNPTSLINGGANNTSTRTVVYNSLLTYKPQVLAQITSYNKLGGAAIEALYLNYVPTTNQSGVLLSSISMHYGARVISFIYNKVIGGTRDYLAYFGESQCAANGLNYNSNIYRFDYFGVDYITNGLPRIPDISLDGTAQDYWGYPNAGVDPGAPRIYVYPDNASFPNLERYRLTPITNYTGTVYMLNGEIKTVDPTFITTGTLSKITYPYGGNTIFTYEPNDYYDKSAAIFSPTAATFQGGGLRIKQIQNYDGLNSANNIIKNYSYIDPVTGYTSGKPIVLPVPAFSQVYTGTATGLDYWNYSTVRLSFSSSNQNETVIYSNVTEQQTGAGKMVYQFTTPATFWDASAGTDWTPTVVNVGRSISGGVCPALGILKNTTYTYPFPPNINYDFERGLPTTVTTYNDAGALVSKSTFTYTRSFLSPYVITGLKMDSNASTNTYSKYQIFTSTSNLITSETKIINDFGNTTNDPNKQTTSTTTYSYLSAAHKQPTKIETTNKDGSINRTYLKYAKDYSWPVGSTDPLKYLTDLNVNTISEKYYSVVRSSTEKYFAAELTKYGSFPSGVASPSQIYLPAQLLKFISSGGDPNFTPSQVNSGIFQYYSGYFVADNYTDYNSSGTLLTADDNHKTVMTSISDDNFPSTFGKVLNASYKEVAYSNFDGSENKFGFTQTGGTINSTNYRTGYNSLTLPVGALLQTTKNLKLNSRNYVFSGWINAATAGTLTISLYNSSGSLFGTKTISFQVSNPGWLYYEQKINTNGLTSSFNLKVQTSTTINIDDVLFYPEDAEVTTYAYTKYSLLRTAETNTNGVSKYYGYDPFYRLQYVYDQDKNIIQKKTYTSANSIAMGLVSASFTTSPSTGINTNTNITFTGLVGSGACTPGTSYAWDFGDGTVINSSLTAINPTHTYATAGNYSVTLTISNSIFGTKTYTQVITVLFVAYYCQSGVWAYASGQTYTMTCGGYLHDAFNSYFQVSGFTGLPTGHTVSYQWQIAYTATGTNCQSTSWTNVGTNYVQYIKPFSPATFCPYQIRCLITDTNNGQIVTTGILAVANTIN